MILGHFHLPICSLLQLATPLTFGQGVSAIALPTAELQIQGGQQAMVSGWGVTSVSFVFPNLGLVILKMCITKVHASMLI